MELQERFERAAAAAGLIIDRIAADQLELPTPCTEWSVRQVALHIVGGMNNLAARLRGLEPGGQEPAGTDLSAAFAAAIADVREAFKVPGALERGVQTPFGEQPGAVLVEVRIVELLVHGWDLASATGQPTNFEPEVAHQTLETARALIGDGPRSADVPFRDAREPRADASEADRLAAFFGRA